MERGRQPATVTAHALASDPDDDSFPRPSGIRQPDVRLNREAINRWLYARSQQQPVKVQRCCALCDRPAATIDWRPAHPGWSRLCITHRVQLHEWVARTSIRVNGSFDRLLDALMRALCLIEFD